jgi:hypothetical protein
MKITVQLQGGYAGGQVPPMSIDSEHLSAGEASTLVRLADAAKAEKAPHRTEGMRDRVTIEDGGQTIVLSPSAAEASKYPAFCALLDWLDAHS